MARKGRAQPSGKRRRPSRETMAGTYTEAELERCRAMSWHVERVAGRLFSVRTVRERLFGDPAATVTPEQAHRLLASPASRHVPLRKFTDLDIPWRDHWCEDSKVTPWRVPDVADGLDVTLTLCAPGRREPWSDKVTVADAEGIHEPRVVRHPTADGREGITTAFRGTPLYLLAGAARSTADQMLWTERDATWFLLTGTAPAVEPVRSWVEVAHDDKGQPLRAEMVLRVQVFLTHRSADRALARARRLALRRQGLRRAFPMEQSNVALFLFVEEQTQHNGGVRPSWGTLLARWNATQRKEWQYGDRSHLRRDYERARRHLTQAPKVLKAAEWVPSTVLTPSR